MDMESLPQIVVAGIPVDRPEPEIHVLAAIQDMDRIYASQRLQTGLANISPRLAARAQPLRLPLSSLFAEMDELRRAGKKVAILADGDPLFFGIGATLAREMGRDAIRVLPAVTSLQAACARLKLAWHDMLCISLHGRDNWQPLFAAVGKGRPLCVLTDARATPARIARELIERGCGHFVAHVFSRMGARDEKVQHADLAVLAQATEAHECFASDTTLILVPMDGAKGGAPCFGLDGKEAQLAGPYHSQAAVRATALHLLQVAHTHTVWDIGAGTGAVALEACALAREGQVVAVECSDSRVQHLHSNRKKFAAATLEIVHGRVPDCLDALPAPDRVFVGGGLAGDAAEDILSQIVRRLPVGGRMVIACVLLQTLTRCRDVLDKLGLRMEMVQVQASATEPLANDVHFVAQNPVFLLAGTKNDGPAA